MIHAKSEYVQVCECTEHMTYLRNMIYFPYCQWLLKIHFQSRGTGLYMNYGWWCHTRGHKGSAEVKDSKTAQIPQSHPLLITLNRSLIADLHRARHAGLRAWSVKHSQRECIQFACSDVFTTIVVTGDLEWHESYNPTFSFIVLLIFAQCECDSCGDLTWICC